MKKDIFANTCMEKFWVEVWFIKALLKELESKPMNEIIDTYHFNIGYNMAMKDLSQWFEEQMNTLMWKDQTEEIAKELWAVERKVEETKE